MALKTLNNINIKLNVKFFDNKFNFGDILKLSYDDSEDLYFYLISHDIDNGLIYVKPLSQKFFEQGSGVSVGDIIYNTRSGSYCTISGPLFSDTLIKADLDKYVNIMSDEESSGINGKNRHNLIYSKNGKYWNEGFLKDTAYENASRLSFISVNDVSNLPNLYRDFIEYPSSAIKISNNYCIAHAKSVNYYLNNGVKFLNTKNIFVNRRISSTISVLDCLKNIDEYTEKKLLDIFGSKINDIIICKFDSPIEESNLVESAKFVPSNYVINKNEIGVDFILINRLLSGGLFKSEWNDYDNSFIRIKNINNLDSYGNSDYVTDYIYGLMPQDDFSLLLGNCRGSIFVFGILLFEDMVSNLGVIDDGKKFGVVGNDFTGEVSRHLYDSGNYCTVKQISYKFDSSFSDLIKDCLKYLSDGLDLIQTVDVKNNFQDSVKENYDFRKVYHTYFLGENLPKIIDAKFSTKDNYSYISGSSFLERNVTPVPTRSNFSGDLGSSFGLSYIPNYFYEKNQYKVFNLPFNGSVSVDVPKSIEFKNYYRKKAYTSSYKINFCLNENIGRYKSAQFKNTLSDYGVINDGQKSMEKTIDGLFYKNLNGSVSRIFRHDCAAIMFYLSSSAESFINGLLSEKFSWNDSVVFISPDFYGHSLSSYICAYSFTNSLNELSYCDKNGDLIYGSSEDIDVMKYEISRIISCLRNFASYEGTDIYEDFIAHARNCAIENKIEDIDNYIKNLKSNLNYISKMKIFLGGFGEPEVDIFAACRDDYGGVIPNFSSSDSFYEYLNGLALYNTSGSIAENLNNTTLSLKNDGLSDIWNSYFYHEDSYLDSYSKNNDQSNIRISINKHIDSCVDNWLDLVDYFSDQIDGYVIYCYDDVTFVNYNETRARNHYLIKLFNRKIKNTKVDLESAIAFSPISFTIFKSHYNDIINNGYLINADRIIDNSIQSCLSESYLFFQIFNVDNFIVDNFNTLDLYYNNQGICVFENARSASCFFSSIYNPNVMNGLNFKENFIFPLLNSGESGAFKKYENLFIQNSYSGVQEYESDVMPLGSEIKDSSVELDRFVIRKKIFQSAQDIISRQIGEVIYFINNNLKYTDDSYSGIVASEFYLSLNPVYENNLKDFSKIYYDNYYILGDFLKTIQTSEGERSYELINSERLDYRLM